ncbi:4-oxalocrotonate tautomerase (plasmid) [Caballeronia insecticola]|uniref:4-oxalocrotonate tautomerase n=1 Tax=Caballeronia insecticola TaxID=758793 RepID=R4X1K7_9BURK|nr:4-oxalocrotonate tautomerase [Caballeronia insecticola]
MLDDKARARLANEITRAHSLATGAQSFFAQVLFHETPKRFHFMGGKPVDSEQVFVHGHIRSGRTTDQKVKLLGDILGSVRQVTGLDSRYVWIYLSELPPSDMIEYGQVLPQPGAESAWLQALSEEDRAYLNRLAERAE